VWTQEKNDKLKKDLKAEILGALKSSEREKKPHLDHLFSDVYDQLTSELEVQKKEMYDHIQKYPAAYPRATHSDQL